MLSKVLKTLSTSFSTQKEWHHTTILALKRNGETVIIGDGQVTHGNIRVKTDGKKIVIVNNTTKNDTLHLITQ